MNYHNLKNEFKNIILKECLDELDRKEREIILLYYWWGYRDIEIGEILDESQQTINYRRHKTLKKIRETFLNRV